jgi:hypothetical protein
MRLGWLLKVRQAGVRGEAAVGHDSGVCPPAPPRGIVRRA